MKSLRVEEEAAGGRARVSWNDYRTGIDRANCSCQIIYGDKIHPKLSQYQSVIRRLIKRVIRRVIMCNF